MMASKREVRLKFLTASSFLLLLICYYFFYEQRLIYNLVSLLLCSFYESLPRFTVATTNDHEESGHVGKHSENSCKCVFPVFHSSSFSDETCSWTQRNDAALQQTAYFMPAVSQGMYEDTRSRDNCSVSRLKSQHRAWPHPIIYCDEFQSSWYRSAHLVSFHVCDKFWLCLACRSISLKIPIPLLHTEPRLGLMDHSEGHGYSHI